MHNAYTNCIRFGASIQVNSFTTSTVYSQLEGNPQCPFLYEDLNFPPQNWTNVSISVGRLPKMYRMQDAQFSCEIIVKMSYFR